MKLPEDWTIKSLEEIAHKVMVGIASAATHAYSNSGILMLRNLNIKENGIDESNLLFIDPEYELQHKNKRIKAGDVITVRTGYPGLSAVVPDKFDSAQCFTSLITRPKTEVINSHFLCVYINSEYGRKFITESEAGGAQKNVNAGVLSKMPVPLPSMQEQCKIVEILGAWDESIALLEKLITAKRKLKQGLMQQLLTGKKRFKEFEGSEWKTVSIEEIAFVDRRSLRSNTPEYYTFRYISLSDINNGEISKDLPEICFAEAPSRARKLVSNNDIIMATVRPNLKAFSIIKSDADKYVVSTGFAVITTKKGYSADYLYQYIFSDRIEQQINALVTGSNYPAINSSEIKQLSVYCPSFPEQEKIASVLSAADTEISTLEKQLAAYKQQKRGLMQQLLTGKTRVNVN